jgi:hypothetical protein
MEMIKMKIPEGFTFYTLQKLCLQCWRNNIEKSTKCAYCGHIFYREASIEESNKMIELLNEKRDKLAEKEAKK